MLASLWLLNPSCLVASDKDIARVGAVMVFRPDSRIRGRRVSCLSGPTSLHAWWLEAGSSQHRELTG